MNDLSADQPGPPNADLPPPPDTAAPWPPRRGSGGDHLWAAFPLTLIAWGVGSISLPGELWDSTPYLLVLVGCVLVGCLIVVALMALGLRRSPRTGEERRRTLREAAAWMAVLSVFAVPAAFQIHRSLPHNYVPQMEADLANTHLDGLELSTRRGSLERCVWNVDDTQEVYVEQWFRITDGSDPEVAAKRLQEHFESLGYDGDDGLTVWTEVVDTSFVDVTLEATRCSFWGDQ